MSVYWLKEILVLFSFSFKDFQILKPSKASSLLSDYCFPLPTTLNSLAHTTLLSLTSLLRGNAPVCIFFKWGIYLTLLATRIKATKEQSLEDLARSHCGNHGRGLGCR